MTTAEPTKRTPTLSDATSPPELQGQEGLRQDSKFEIVFNKCCQISLQSKVRSSSGLQGHEGLQRDSKSKLLIPLAATTTTATTTTATTVTMTSHQPPVTSM